MKYIFLDESGDLDFKCRSGNYFIIAALCSEDPKPIYNCIKRIKRRTSKKYYKAQELHFSKSDYKLRRRVLKCVVKNDINISYLLLDKKKFMKTPKHNLISHKGNLKNILFLILISSTLNRLNIKGNPKIIIDKYLSTDRIDEFNILFDEMIRGNHSYINRDIVTEHTPSYENKGIQAVDFIVGAIHQNFRENRNSILYKLIEPKIQHKIRLVK